jgi:hypothetical protein
VLAHSYNDGEQHREKNIESPEVAQLLALIVEAIGKHLASRRVFSERK